MSQAGSYSTTFRALLNEAHFTNEMLGAGATQIRGAGYASKGVYFQSFTSLSTGLERIGKLCLMLDFFIETQSFPDQQFMKREIGHKLSVIYEKSKLIITKRQLALKYLQNLDRPIHRAIIQVLSAFAAGDRYSNINVLVGASNSPDPIAQWHQEVDQAIFQNSITPKRKEAIRANASMVAAMMEDMSSVIHTSETGRMITSIADASQRTGMFKAIAPYRQLYVLQIIRYWVEILWALQHQAQSQSTDIPYFGEIFTIFINSDSDFRKRKTWTTS